MPASPPVLSSAPSSTPANPSSASTRAPTRDLTQGPIGRTLLVFALPILAGNVLQSLNGSVNAVWVGRYLGEAALTATANANNILFLLIGAVFGVGMAATILVAQAMGGARSAAGTPCDRHQRHLLRRHGRADRGCRPAALARDPGLDGHARHRPCRWQRPICARCSWRCRCSTCSPSSRPCCAARATRARRSSSCCWWWRWTRR